MSEQTKGVVGRCKQFECKVVGFPRPSVRWYKDGVNITTDKRYKFDYTREGYVTLIIDNVTYKDQGAYQCQADNSEGRASTSAYLLVRGHSSTLEDEISAIHSMTFERSDLPEPESGLEKETSKSKKRPLIIDEEAVFNKSSQLNGHLGERSGIKELIQRLHAETNNEDYDQNSLSFNDELNTVQTADEDSAFSSSTELQNSNQEKHSRKISGIGENDAMGRKVNDNNMTNDKSFGTNDSKPYTASDSPMTVYDETIHNSIKLTGNIPLTSDMDTNSSASTSEVTDDSVDAGVDENVADSSEENNKNEINQDLDEELQHYLDDLALGLKGHDKSRRWTTDSGILSRESSLSSEPDMVSISHDAMVEMQEYLKGKTNVIYENFGKERNLENESHARAVGTILQNYDNKTMNDSSLKLKRSESFVNEIKLDAFDDEIIEDNELNESERQMRLLPTTENNDQIDRQEEKVLPNIQSKSIDNIYQKSREPDSHVHESEHLNPREKNLAFISDNETHTVDAEVIRERKIKPNIRSQVESHAENVSLLNETSGYTEAAQPINNNIGTSGNYDSTGARYATGETDTYVGVSYSIIPDYLNGFLKSVQQTVTPVSHLEDTGRADADKSFALPVDNYDTANVEKTKDIGHFVFNNGIFLSEPENKQQATFNRPESRADEIDTMSRRIEHRSLKILDWSYLEDPESIINAGKYLIDDNPIVDLTPAVIITEKLQRQHGHFANSTILESRAPESEKIPIHREILQEIQVEREPSDGLKMSTVFEGDMPISRMTKFKANVSELSGGHGAVEAFSAPETNRVISHEVVSQTISEINRFEDKASDSVTEETRTEETEDNKGRSKRGVKEIIREKTKVSKTSEVTEKITVTKEYEKTTIETNGDSSDEGEPYVVSTIREENVPALESSVKAQTMDEADVKQAQVKAPQEKTSETSVIDTSGLTEVPKASEKAIKDKSAVKHEAEVKEDTKLPIRDQSGEAKQESLAIMGTLDLVNVSEQDTKIKTGEETKRAREVHTRIEESEAELLTTDKPIVAISNSMKVELSQASTGMTQSVVQETVITSEKKSKQETISEFIQETRREASLLSSEEGAFRNAISAVQETKVEEMIVTLDKGLVLESATGMDTRQNEVLDLDSKTENSQEAVVSVETSISPKQPESGSDIMKTTEKETTLESTFAEMKQVAQVETVRPKVSTSIAEECKESGVTGRHKTSFESSTGNDCMTTEEGGLMGRETSISAEYDIVELKNLRNKLELEKSVQVKAVDIDAIKTEISAGQNAGENDKGLTEKDHSSIEKAEDSKANIVSTAEIISYDIKESPVITESSTKSDSNIDKGISVDVTVEKSARSDNSEPGWLSATIDVGSSVIDTNGHLNKESISASSQSVLTQDNVQILTQANVQILTEDDFRKEVAEEEVKAETAKKNITVQMSKQVGVTAEGPKTVQGVDEKEIDQQKEPQTDAKIEKGALSTTKSDADREKITVTEIEQPGTSNESREKGTTSINEKEVEVPSYANDSQEVVGNVEEKVTVTDEFITTQLSDVEQQYVGTHQFKDTIGEDKAEETLADISSSESQPIKNNESEIETIETGTLEKKIVKTDVNEVTENVLVDWKLAPGTEKFETDVKVEFAEKKTEMVKQLNDESELKRPLYEKDSKLVQKSTVPDEVSEEVIEEVITAIKRESSESGVEKTLCALEELEMLRGEVKTVLKMEDKQHDLSKGKCSHESSEQEPSVAKHIPSEETATKDVNQRLTANAEKKPENNAKEVEEVESPDEKIRNKVQSVVIQAESLNEPSSGIIQDDKTNGELKSQLRDKKISKTVTPNVEPSEMGQKKEKLSDKTLEEISKNNDKLEALKPMTAEVKEKTKKEKSAEKISSETEERTALTISEGKDSVKEEIIQQLKTSKPTEKDKEKSQNVPMHDCEDKIEPKLVADEKEKSFKAGGEETVSKNDEPILRSEKEAIREVPLSKRLEEKDEPTPIDISDSQRKEIKKTAKTKAIDEITENISKTISYGENKTDEKTGSMSVEIPETQIQETKLETIDTKIDTTFKELFKERNEEKSGKESTIGEATEGFLQTSLASFDELDAVYFSMETLDTPNLRPVEDVTILSLDTQKSMSPVSADIPAKANAQMDAEVRTEIKPRIWTDSLDISRRIEETLRLKWRVEGFPPPKVEFYKDGILLLQDDRITLKCTDTDVILEICDLIPSDSGDYAVKAHNSVGDDVSLVTVHVTSSTEPTDEAIRQSYTVPAFVVKPTLEISDKNGVSIKCAVEGDPLPEVVWYREGEALEREDYWRRFMKEGFHHLEVKNPALLDEGQFACRLQNDAGFAVHVFTFRWQGDKIVCSEVSAEEVRYITSPKIDLEITESQDKNLMLYKIISSHFDPINSATLDKGEIIHVLGTHLDKQWLVQAKSSLSKICYAPVSLICPADGSRETNGAELIQDSGLSHDAQGSEGKRNVVLASEEQTKSTSKQELGDNKKEQADRTDIMPERRKIQKPSIKKAPQGDREVDSPEFHRVLEPKDDTEQQKGKLSDDRSIAPEYNDGTTRPMFKKKLKKVACNLGDTTELVCVVSGNPAPKVLWLKNNRPLKDTDGCRVVVDGAMNMLIFPSVTEDDLGLYTARAMNVNGSVMSSEELTLRDGRDAPNVAAPPESPMDLDFNTPSYFFQMSSCHVEEGRLARFDCRVVAYPRPDIVWMRDGKVVESSERYKLLNFNNEIYSLLIQNVEIADTGRYTCWARNKFGEAMTEAYLNVIALKADKEEGDLAPNFLTRFYDQKVTEGVPAEFKCIIEGRPMPAVTWVMNDMEIREGPGIKVRHQDGMVSLELKSTKREHAGEYTCHISNPLGQAKCSATLTVLEDKLKGPILPKFLKRFDHISAREGDEAKFECIVVGEPSPTITWLFDHKPIHESNKRFVITREGDIHTLTVKGVRFEDDGKITCKAFNNEGEVYCSANMYVRESKKSRETPESMILGTSPAGAKPDSFEAKHGYVPTFTKRLNDYAAPVGTRAKLECKVMGIPDPDISWMKDGRVISPGGRYVMKRDDGVCTLIIDNLNAGDAGVFTCIASNAAGKSSSLAQLKVGDEKEMPMERSHDEDRYTPSKRPLKDLSVTDGVPTIPYDKPSLLDVRGDAAKLSWLPAKTSNLPTEARRVSYIVESRELPGYEWTKVSTGIPGNTYFARNLRPDKEYEFRVRAQNQYGVSEPTKVTSLPKREEDVKKLFVDLPELRVPPRLPVSRPIITEMGDETVRLAWKPVESIHSRPHPSVSYRLEAKTLPGTEWTPITSRIQDTTHYFSELMPDRDYLFRVRAENEFGVSEPTDSLWLPRARRFTGVPIERPQIVELEPHQARLRWQRVNIPVFDHDDEPLLYMLEMEEPPRDWRTIAYDLDDTEYIIDGLKPGRDYKFRVRAKSPAGVISEPSPIASLYTTLAQTRTPIDRLEVERYEPDTQSMQLSWQRVDIPPFDIKDEPLMYMLEYRVPHISDWRTLVSGIPMTRYRVTELMPDQDYQFRVRALSPYGISQPSPVLPVSYRQLSAAPIRPLYTGQLELTDFEPDGLRLSWRPPVLDTSQQIRYKVERQEPPRLDWVSLASGLTDTSYRVTGLHPTKDYKFRVIPEVGGHYYEPTPPVSLSTIPVRPRMPMQEPMLREHGPDSVQLSWPPAEFPIYQRQRIPLYYSLEMMELPSTTWVPVGRRISDTTYTVTGLRPDRDYKFRVRAVTDFVSSEPSLPVTFYRRPAPIFPHHEPLVKDVSANAILLTWQPALFPGGGIAAPVTYHIEMQTPPGVSTWTTILANHPSCSARLTDLRPDLDYLVRVRAQFKDILTEPTLPVYIPRRAVPPRLPCDEPYPVEISPNAVKLQWRSAELPVHINDYSPVTYRVEVQEQPDKSWVTVARGIPHTDFKITNLNPEKDYMFRIRGENDYGLSEPTRPVHIRKRAADKPVFAPRLPSDAPLIFDVGSGSAKLSWRPADIPSYFSDLTPIYYTIYIQEPTSKSWRPLVRKIPHTMYHVTGLLPDRDYDFRVQAENEFGASQPTESARLPRKSGYKAPVYIPEIDDFDADYTAVKLRWKPQAVTPYTRSSMRYQVESWEPLARTWHPLVTGISEPSYTIRGLKSGVDNLYRIRAEADQLGPSEPSVPISVSRDNRRYRTILSDNLKDQYRIPVYRPQLHEVEPDSVKLSWQPSRLPSTSYGRPVRYTVEMREIPSQVWRPIATELHDTAYRATNLRPKSEYEFRVRALTDNGPSEPSLPVPLYRRPVIPTVRLEAPEIFDVDDDAMTLRWARVDVPAFSRDEEPITFMIETQRLPNYEWQPMVRGLTSTQHRITGLKPYQDYIFRVRGEYPSGYTAPSPPVPVYRRPSESDFLTNWRPSRYSVQSYASIPKQRLSRPPQKHIYEPLPTQSLRASLPRPASSFHQSPHRPLSLKESTLVEKPKSIDIELLPRPKASEPVPAYKKRRFSIVNDIVSFFEKSRDHKTKHISDELESSKFTAFVKDGLLVQDSHDTMPKRRPRTRSLGFITPTLRQSISVDLMPKVLGIDISEKIKTYQEVLRLPSQIFTPSSRSSSLVSVRDTYSQYKHTKIIDDDDYGIDAHSSVSGFRGLHGNTLVYSTMDDKFTPAYCVLEDKELSSIPIHRSSDDASPGYFRMSKFSVLVDIPGTSCDLPRRSYRSDSPYKRVSGINYDDWKYRPRPLSPSINAILSRYPSSRTSSPNMFYSRESSTDSLRGEYTAPETKSSSTRKSRSPVKSFKFSRVPIKQEKYPSHISKPPSILQTMDGRFPVKISPVRSKHISSMKDKDEMFASPSIRSLSLDAEKKRTLSPAKELKQFRSASVAVPSRRHIPDSSFQTTVSTLSTQKYSSKFESPKWDSKYDSQKYSRKYESPSVKSYLPRSASVGSLYKTTSMSSLTGYGKERSFSRYESPYSRVYQPRSSSINEASYQSRSLSRDYNFKRRISSSSYDLYKPESESHALSHKPSNLFMSLSRDTSYRTSMLPRTDYKGSYDYGSTYASSATKCKSASKGSKFMSSPTRQYSKTVSSIWPQGRSRSLPKELSRFYDQQVSYSSRNHSHTQYDSTQVRYPSHDSSYRTRSLSNGRSSVEYGSGLKYSTPERYSAYSRFSSEPRLSYRTARARSASPVSSTVQDMFSNIRSSLDRTRSASRYQVPRLKDRSPSAGKYSLTKYGQTSKPKATKVIRISSASRDKYTPKPDTTKYSTTMTLGGQSVYQHGSQTSQNRYLSQIPKTGTYSQSKTQTHSSTINKKLTNERSLSPNRKTKTS